MSTVRILMRAASLGRQSATRWLQLSRVVVSNAMSRMSSRGSGGSPHAPFTAANGVRRAILFRRPQELGDGPERAHTPLRARVRKARREQRQRFKGLLRRVGLCREQSISIVVPLLLRGTGAINRGGGWATAHGLLKNIQRPRLQGDKPGSDTISGARGRAKGTGMKSAMRDGRRVSIRTSSPSLDGFLEVVAHEHRRGACLGEHLL